MLYIHGMGDVYPDNIISNDFLQELNIGTNPQWILERVGIRERRTLLSLDYIKKTYNKNLLEARQHSQYTAAQLGAQAAKKALAKANIETKDIGMVIAGSSATPYYQPANACVIANELGIQALAFDVNSVCATFAVQMNLLNAFDSASLPDYVLIVISETWTNIFDYSHRETAVLAGDAAIAAVVSKKIKSPFVVTNTFANSDPSGWNKVFAPVGKHFQQDGPGVQKFAIKKNLLMIDLLREQGNIAPQEHYFISHQANLVMLQSVCRLANISEDKHLFNVDQYGNCAAAGAPSVLSQNWDKFIMGDKIILTAVGAGLTWGGMVIEVGEKK